MSQANGSHDVQILAPTAIAIPAAGLPGGVPTPEELTQLQAARIRELEGELQDQHIACNTISVYALALAGYLIEEGYGLGDEVRIPRSLVARFDGGHVAIEEQGDEVIVRVRTRES